MSTTAIRAADSPTIVKSTDLTKLHNAIEGMDCISQDFCDKISSLARLALRVRGHNPFSITGDEIDGALRTIDHFAQDMSNSLNCAAEDVGCHYSADDSSPEPTEDERNAAKGQLAAEVSEALERSAGKRSSNFFGPEADKKFDRAAVVLEQTAYLLQTLIDTSENCDGALYSNICLCSELVSKVEELLGLGSTIEKERARHG